MGVIDLSELSGIAENVEAGDKVRVADPDFDIDVRTSVVRFYRDHLDSTNNEVELASLEDPLDLDSNTSGRGQSGENWEQFSGPVRGTYQVRNDATHTVARIPLRFRAGGYANVHADLRLVGVGAGTATVWVYDAETDATVHRVTTIAYTDGGTVHASLDFALENLSGAYDFRLRVTTAATGGAGGAKGVNIAPDVEDVASFYILAQGAVRETPVADNSVTYDFTGAVQEFVVPDNVTEIIVQATGGSGGDTGDGGTPGAGGSVMATFPVVPGAVYDVVVGGAGHGNIPSPATTYPNGGAGGDTGSDSGAGGGGSSDIRPTGTTIASALIVAGGGGGTSEGANGGVGGAGGFYAGQNGLSALGAYAAGATQSAGGSGGTGGGGADGSFGQGGDGGGSGSAFDGGGGGGGGGWYGGEGGSIDGSGTGGVGGGGGSGWCDPSGSDLWIEDGVNSGNGQIVISWEDPLPNV
jgi:hypothetical protein